MSAYYDVVLTEQVPVINSTKTQINAKRVQIQKRNIKRIIINNNNNNNNFLLASILTEV
jgi:hypothetical protein